MTYYLEGFELEQFNIIVACFRQYVLQEGQPLPEQFRTEEVDIGYFGIKLLGSRKKIAVLYRYNSTSFSPHHWQTPITIVPIRNAIHAICAYQTARHARAIGNGCLLDPSNLLCEELKSWLAKLACCDLSDGHVVKAEIARYTAYIKALEQGRVFPASRTGFSQHERTLGATLLEVVEYLQKTEIEIDVLMHRQSLRDVMSALRKSTANAMDSLIQYLFYILRSHKTPAAISVRDIKQHCRSDVECAMQTRSFRLLILLVNSAYVNAVNYEVTDEDDSQGFVFHEEPRLHIKKSWHPVGHFDSDSARRNHSLNQAIGGHLIPDRHCLRRWWAGEHSGISGYFQSQKATLEKFVLLHSLVEKLALFCLISRDLEELVDFFGAKLWAEVGRQVLNNFQEGYRRISNAIRSAAQDVHELANERYRYLTQIGQHKKAWLQNYNTSDRILMALNRELEYGTERISQINRIVDILRSPDKEQEIRQKLTGVVRSLNQFGSFFELQPIALPEVVATSVTSSRSHLQETKFFSKSTYF